MIKLIKECNVVQIFSPWTWGADHMEGAVKGYFITPQELEDRERRAFEAGGLRVSRDAMDRLMSGDQSLETLLDIVMSMKIKSFDDYKKERKE